MRSKRRLSVTLRVQNFANPRTLKDTLVLFDFYLFPFVLTNNILDALQYQRGGLGATRRELKEYNKKKKRSLDNLSRSLKFTVRVNTSSSSLRCKPILVVRTRTSNKIYHSRSIRTINKLP